MAELNRIPPPFEHLVGSEAYHSEWGRGWLGYEILGDTTRIWFVPLVLGDPTLIEHDQIFRHFDRVNSQLWLIFQRNAPFPKTMPFLLHPDEDAVVLPLPRKLRRFIGG